MPPVTAQVLPLIRPAALDKLAEDYERAAAVSLANGEKANWPQTVNDLLVVAFALKYLARQVRERA
jgi:hypothetical protein